MARARGPGLADVVRPVVTRPRETRYAKTHDGVHVAYQVVGDGPVDMVFVMGWVTNVEAMWEEPNVARFLEGQAVRKVIVVPGKIVNIVAAAA